MLFKKFVLLNVSVCFVFSTGFTHPFPLSSRSTENGGIISAIDAYKDGVGAMVVQNGRGIDNSVINSLVFKYGHEAKNNTLTICDKVLLIWK